MALRVIVDTASTPEVTFYSDESAVDADGAVTVTVTRADGSTVASGASTTNVGTGRYRYNLPAQPELECLTLSWQGTFSGVVQTVTTYVDVVGGFYFTLAELRSLPNLGDTVKFTTSELADARRWFETIVERYCGVAFVPRFGRAFLDGNNLSSFDLPHREVRTIRSLTLNGTAWTVDQLATLDITAHTGYVSVEGGVYLFTKGGQNLVVEYDHGLDGAPDDLRQAGLVACRYKLLSDLQGTPARELSIANDLGGTTRYSTPGLDRPTGLLEVDAVLTAYRDRYSLPGIG